LNKYKKSDKDIIALSQNGVQVNRRNLYKTVTKIFTYLGESKQGLHIFRHHFGSNFAQTNGNIKILQDLLGHSSISTTMIYSSVAEDAKERAISLQENIS
jgi:site-specific recombinase XerD